MALLIFWSWLVETRSKLKLDFEGADPAMLTTYFHVCWRWNVSQFRFLNVEEVSNYQSRESWSSYVEWPLLTNILSCLGQRGVGSRKPHVTHGWPTRMWRPATDRETGSYIARVSFETFYVHFRPSFSVFSLGSQTSSTFLWVHDGRHYWSWWHCW